MGTPKGLVLVDGRPWLTHQIAAIGALTTKRPIVVLGFDQARYRREVPDLGERAVVVVNPAPERGPFSSLQQGLSRTTPERPAFVLPVDVPAPEPAVWASLRIAMAPGFDAAVPTHGGRGGHPVLLSSHLAARLQRLGADARLDVELRRCTVVRVAVDDAFILQNLNAPEDWRAFARLRATRTPRASPPARRLW